MNPDGAVALDDAIVAAPELHLPVTTLLAVALAALFVALALRVVAERRAGGVSLGTAGNERLERRVRGHANLAEYAPFGLVLCALAEAQGAPWWLLAISALTFGAGRMMHGYAFGWTDSSMRWRITGMQLTVLGLGGLAVTALGSLL